MKLKQLIFLLLLFPFSLLAQWIPVGKADYNWGPFSVYSIELYTETGNYQESQRPLMLTFNFDKQIEGKDFAVSLTKEMSLSDEENGKLWLKVLQRIFPDFSQNDRLSYIALEKNGYFVLNDTVLDYEFDSLFSQTLIDIWLSPNTRFEKMREKLLAKDEKERLEDMKEKLKTPENLPLREDDTNPQLPPEHELDNPSKGIS